MFSQPDKITVTSSNGFTIKHIRHNLLKYIEGEKTLTIEVEGGQDKHHNFCHLGAMTRWDAPHQDEWLTPEKKSQIQEDLAKALLFEEIFPEFR